MFSVNDQAPGLKQQIFQAVYKQTKKKNQNSLFYHIPLASLVWVLVMSYLAAVTHQNEMGAMMLYLYTHLGIQWFQFLYWSRCEL